MKRFVGWLLVGVGALGVAWGGYHVVSGTSQARLTITDEVRIDGLTGGLIGLAMLTVGLIWARD